MFFILVSKPAILEVLNEYVQSYAELTNYAKRAELRAIEYINRSSFLAEGGECVSGKKLVGHLQTCPGVGPVCSHIWALEIVDASRFKNARAIAAYCGLDPSLKVSAGKGLLVVDNIRNAGRSETRA